MQKTFWVVFALTLAFFSSFNSSLFARPAFAQSVGDYYISLTSVTVGPNYHVALSGTTSGTFVGLQSDQRIAIDWDATASGDCASFPSADSLTILGGEFNSLEGTWSASHDYAPIPGWHGVNVILYHADGGNLQCLGSLGTDKATAGTGFKINQLTIGKEGRGGGLITSLPAGIECPGVCMNGFASSTTITLTATPWSNGIFSHWTGGDCDGVTSTACQVSLIESQFIRGTFDIVTSTISVVVSGLQGSDVASITANNSSTFESMTTSTGNGVLPIAFGLSDRYGITATTTNASYTLAIGTGCDGYAMASTTCTLAFAVTGSTSTATTTPTGTSTIMVQVSGLRGEDVALVAMVHNPPALESFATTTGNGSFPLVLPEGDLYAITATTTSSTYHLAAGDGCQGMATDTICALVFSWTEATSTATTTPTSTSNGGGGGAGGGSNANPTVGVGAGGAYTSGGSGNLSLTVNETPAATTTATSSGVVGPETGIVLGTTTSSLDTICPEFLPDNLSMWKQNDPMQVKILQEFLNQEMDANVPVTGYFGPLTYRAVLAFQLKYHENVLRPWVPFGLASETTPTGYVSLFTRWQVRSLMCPGVQIAPPVLTDLKQ